MCLLFLELAPMGRNWAADTTWRSLKMRGIAVSCYGARDAGVAELADALDSKSSDRKVVGVQVPPPVLLIYRLF
jgi:hypothetical protein